MIIGIDPGANIGVATYKAGVLVSLHTTDILGLISFIKVEKPSRVIYEDSRLQSVVFNRGTNIPTSLKIARNIGEIDAWCNLIVMLCDDLKIPAHGVSPKDKGHKLNAEQFLNVTGWQDKSNQHTRDAAMVAWPYRGAK